MDRAYIYQSISTSLQVAELSVLGQIIFERMFPHADFQGRLPGHPRKIKATVIPMIDASAEEVAEQLRKMHDLGLIVWYEASGEKYTQLVSWWKFQPLRFSHPSKFPAPEGWKDRLRYNDPRNPKHLIEENWTAHAPVGRPRKGDEEEPTQDAYIGDLHRPPTQAAYEGSEIHPSASALALKDQTLLSEPPVSDGSNGGARKPSRSRKKKKRISDRYEYPADFMEFWSEYPRRENKSQAFKEWTTEKEHNPEFSLPRLILSARTYAAEVAGKESQYIKMPSTFLHAGTWMEKVPADLDPRRECVAS